jgi:predicted HicB family RNase H-like nuclease
MRTKKPEAKLNVRFPPEMLDALRVLAAKQQRSLNGEIIWILRAYLEQEAK